MYGYIFIYLAHAAKENTTNALSGVINMGVMWDGKNIALLPALKTGVQMNSRKKNMSKQYALYSNHVWKEHIRTRSRFTLYVLVILVIVVIRCKKNSPPDPGCLFRLT